MTLNYTQSKKHLMILLLWKTDTSTLTCCVVKYNSGTATAAVLHPDDREERSVGVVLLRAASLKKPFYFHM